MSFRRLTSVTTSSTPSTPLYSSSRTFRTNGVRSFGSSCPQKRVRIRVFSSFRLFFTSMSLLGADGFSRIVPTVNNGRRRTWKVTLCLSEVLHHGLLSTSWSASTAPTPWTSSTPSSLSGLWLPYRFRNSTCRLRGLRVCRLLLIAPSSQTFFSSSRHLLKNKFRVSPYSWRSTLVTGPLEAVVVHVWVLPRIRSAGQLLALGRL